MSMTLRQLRGRRKALRRSLTETIKERVANQRALDRATGKRLCDQLREKLDELTQDAVRYTAGIETVNDKITEIAGVTA